MEFVGGSGGGGDFFDYLGDGIGGDLGEGALVEGGRLLLGVSGAEASGDGYGVGAPVDYLGVVQEGVGASVDYFVAEGGGLGGVAEVGAHLAGADVGEELSEAVYV